VSEFLEECLREWQRLGVPDPIANEMAADLKADLDEAEAEGASAEDVLGNSAFDPRRFAAAWATARGVTRPPVLDRPTFRHRPIAIVLTGLLGVLTVSAGLILLVGERGRSVAVSAGRIVAGPRSIFVPGSRRMVFPGPLGQFVGPPFGGVNVHPIALLVLIVGIVGLALLGVMYWSPRWGARRYQNRRGVHPPYSFFG
jgi:hypothetical protein